MQRLNLVAVRIVREGYLEQLGHHWRDVPPCTNETINQKHWRRTIGERMSECVRYEAIKNCRTGKENDVFMLNGKFVYT